MQCVVNRIGIARLRGLDAQLDHALVEELPVFTALYCLEAASDHLDAITGEHARFREFYGYVQSGLSAERGQDCIGGLFDDDFLDKRCSDGLHVRAVCHLRVGHDGCRVAVHEHHTIAFLAQHLARLSA